MSWLVHKFIQQNQTKARLALALFPHRWWMTYLVVLSKRPSCRGFMRVFKLGKHESTRSHITTHALPSARTSNERALITARQIVQKYLFIARLTRPLLSVFLEKRQQSVARSVICTTSVRISMFRTAEIKAGHGSCLETFTRFASVFPNKTLPEIFLVLNVTVCNILFLVNIK